MHLNKKILILGGAGVHNKIVRAAKDMGLYTIVVDNVINSPAKKEADESWLISLTDTDSIARKAKAENVDAVINLNVDPAQYPYHVICKKMNLPCYATEEQVLILTEKDLFKNFCKKHGVDVIPDYSLSDLEKGNVEYPILVKPNHSRGSRGQMVCYDKDSAMKAYESACKESFDGRALCEKYMVGKQDLATAFFVVNGEPYLVKLGDRYMGDKKDGLDRQVICTWLPSKFADKFEQNVLPRVKNMIRALGVKFGPVFIQGFIDGDTVRFYDPGIRMPGGDYDLVLKEATGFDTVRTAIEFSLTGNIAACVGNPANCYRLNGKIGILLCFSLKQGKIDRIEGFDNIKQSKKIVYSRLLANVGDIIHNTGDVKQRAAALGALVDNENDLKELINEIYSKVHFIDEHGDDMLISKYAMY